MTCEVCQFRGSTFDELKRHVADKHYGPVHIYHIECYHCEYKVARAVRPAEGGELGHELMTHHFQWYHPDIYGHMCSVRRVTIDQAPKVVRVRHSPSYIKDYYVGAELRSLKF